MIDEPERIRLTEAVTALVQLYEATGKKQDAAKWQGELTQRQAADKVRAAKAAAAGKSKKASVESKSPLSNAP